MYINKINRFKFRFGRRFIGTSLALFFASLTQEFLGDVGLFVIVAVFLGGMSAGAIYVGTKISGFQKFFLSLGFIVLVGLFDSLLLIASCYINNLYICEHRPFQSTIAVYFIMPLASMFLYLFTLFLGSFSKKRYRA